MAEIASAKDIFGIASELAPGERGPYLDGACAGNPALRARVDSLLRAFDEGGVFMRQPTRGEESTGAARAPERPGPAGSPIAEEPGSTIGRYRLLQQIGEGGFGVVFMAEQRDPVVRKVALKIIKLGMDTRQVIARFEAERQALALMDHPCIARVLDAGATETGRPYFVMELVRGEPITAYCDRNNLSPQERLELFVQVCQAVQHAHTKGIIHRDLKPSNVLVTMIDARPVPKVIDFGIAKATSARLTEKTVFTEFRQMVGTPEYMSPEQAEMSGVDVDTRTDIYSLGVLLYELLIGVTPFDARKLRSAAWAELQRIIREEEPSKPSTRLSTMKDTIASVAAHRRTEPGRLHKLVRGDLDWIVMKCLEKSRARRYETASGLGADVRRHLDGEAVLAAPPGAAYRLSKFVRRHRVGVGVGTAVVGALALGIVGTSIGLVRTAVANKKLDDALRSARGQRDAATGALDRIARRFADEPSLSPGGVGAQPEIRLEDLGIGMGSDRAVEALGQAAARLVDGLVQARRKAASEAESARREAGKARAVTDFLQRLLEGVSPEKARANREVTVRQIVDRSAADLESGRAKLDPEIEATVRGALGRLYWALGEPAESRKHLERAIALGAAGSLPKNEVAVLRNDLGNALRDLSDIDGAAGAYQQALEDALEAGGPRSPTAGGAYNSLAGIAMLRGRLDEAGDLYAKALEIMQATQGGDDRDVLQVINNQAVLADKRGRPAEAERLLAPLLDRARAALGEDDPFVAETMLNLGVAHGKQGRFARALELMRSGEQLMRKLYGDKHPRTLSALSQLGGLALFAGDPAEAERAYSAALDGLRTLPAGAGGDLTDALRGYSVALEFLGKPEQAEATRRELVELARAASRPADVATHLANLGQNLLYQRRWEDAEAVLRECVTIRRGLFKEGSPQLWSLRLSESLLGEALMEQAAELAAGGVGKRADPAGAAAGFAEAEPLILGAAESVPGDRNTPRPLPGAPDRARRTLERAVRLYELWQGAGESPERAEKAAAWKRRLDDYGAATSEPGR